MDGLRHFSSDDYARALEDWGWTGAGSLSPIGASPFGDVFLTGPEGVSLLDTLEGRLVPAFADLEEMRLTLATPEGADRFLLSGVASAAADRGLVPEPHQVYAFTVPPVLGGAISVENVEVLDFVVSLSIAGQLHAQVRDLAPGTQVSTVTTSAPAPPKPERRRGIFGRRSR